MDAYLRAELNESERLLVGETDPAALAVLDEDAAIELEARIRRARDKYVGQYRRSASARVAEHGARGTARPENARAVAKAEAFERALTRASHRVAVLARQSATALRAERLAAIRAAKQVDWPGAGQRVPPPESGVPRPRRRGPEVTPDPHGDRALRSPASERARAGTLAAGARRQAKRDNRHTAAR